MQDKTKAAADTIISQMNADDKNGFSTVAWREGIAMQLGAAAEWDCLDVDDVLSVIAQDLHGCATIVLAYNHREGDEFADWLQAEGYDAKVGDTTETTSPDGVDMTDLWNHYCLSDIA